ncbi:MAG: phenylalanine--tRNA ligase beta subunit-related protein, partial [Christensenellaceae bacterium]
SIRQTSRALGLRTESSSRYEKGVDPTLAQTALDRAMGLIEELHAGEIVEGAVDICSADLTPRVIRAEISRINACMGITVEARQMKAILEDLKVPTEIEGGELVCTVPAWRGDLETYADLAEEVLRIYGYEHIPSRLMEGAMQGARTPLQRANNDLKDQLVAMGFYEAVTYTFMSPSVFDRMLLEADSPLRKAIRLLNPLGEDYSLVRTFLAPAMLQSIA